MTQKLRQLDESAEYCRVIERRVQHVGFQPGIAHRVAISRPMPSQRVLGDSGQPSEPLATDRPTAVLLSGSADLLKDLFPREHSSDSAESTDRTGE